MADVEIVISGRDNLSRPVRQASESMQQFTGAANSSRGALDQLSARMANIGQQAVAFAGGMMLMQTVSKGIETVKEAVFGFNASMEKSMIGWETFLKSGESAKAMLFELQVFAAKTPFEFPQLEDASRRLMAMGFAAKDIIPLMVDIGDTSAAMGKGAEGIQRMIFAMGQMKSKGRVMAEEVMQLTEVGIPAWQALADSMKKTIPEVQELVSKGKVSADEFIKAFREFAQANYGGMMDKQSRTFEGAMSTITDSLRMVSATAFRPLFDRFSQLADAIGSFVSSDTFLVWGSRVAAVIDVVLTALGDLVGAFGIAFSNILSIVSSVGQAIYNALQWLNPFATHSPSLVSSVETGVESILQAYGRLGSTGSLLQPAISAINGLKAAASEGLARLEADSENARQKSLAAFGSGVLVAYSAAENAVKGLREELQSLLPALEEQQTLVSVIQGDIDAFSESINSQERSLRSAREGLSVYDDAIRAASESLSRHQEAAAAARAQLDSLNDQLREFTQAPIQGSKALKNEMDEVELEANSIRLALLNARMGTGPAVDVQVLNDRLKYLQDRAEQLRLTDRVKFDPMRKQIASLTDTVKELPFDVIVNGIKRLLPQIAEASRSWQGEVEAVKAAERALKDIEKVRSEQQRNLDNQQRALDKLRIKLEDMQAVYKAEDKSLKDMTKSYQAVVDKISDLEGVLSSVVGQADKSAAATAKAASAAEKAAGISAAASQGVKDKLAGLDFSETTAKLKDFENKFNEMKTSVSNAISPITEALQRVVREIGSAFGGLKDIIQPALKGEWAKIDWKTIWEGTPVFEDFGGVVVSWREGGIKRITDVLQSIWNGIDWASLWEGNEISEDIGGVIISGRTGGLSSLPGRIIASIGEVGGQLQAFFQEQWAKIDWSAVWAIAGTNFQSAMKSALDIKDSLETRLGAQMEVVNWSSIWNRTTGMLAGLVSSLEKQMDTVDWSKTGATIGSAVRRALMAALEVAFQGAEFWNKLLPMLIAGASQIDWSGAGKGMAPRMLDFILGIVTALLDPMVWLGFILNNWWDLFTVIATIMFMPGKIIGVIASALGKIPLAGSMISWILLHLNAVGGEISSRILGLFSQLGGKFVDGIVVGLNLGGVRLFPRLGALIGDIFALFRALPGKLMLWAERLMEDLGLAISTHGPTQVVKSFAWLMQQIDTLLVQTVPNLIRSGARLVEGLWEGILSRAGNFALSLWRWVDQNVIQTVKQILGIASPSSVFLALGMQVVEGLIKGITDKATELWDTAWRMGESIVTAFRGALRSIPIPTLSVGLSIGEGEILGQKIPIPVMNIGVNWVNLGDLIPELYKGGRILREGLALVGERGPELLRLPRGAEVAPLGRGAGAGVGALTIQINAPIYGFSNFEDAIVDAIESGRRRGRI